MKNIRELAYWSLDALKGSRVKKKYNALKSAQESQQSNQNYLSEILSYAKAKVPFYKSIKASQLSEFPVIDKTTMKRDYSAFRSIDYLDDSKLITLHTSGSSGTPFTTYQNKEKDDFHKAGLILKNQEIGWNVGDRWAHLRNWGFGAPATKFERFAKNLVTLSVVNLNDEKLETIVQTLLKDKKLQIILGYSSALERLVQYITYKHYENLDFGIKLIIADSDNLKTEIWDLLEQIFNCPVLNRYANIENGIIAITKPNDRTFYVNTNQVYVEVLRTDSDETVAEGETGRVVITDLHNHAVPFIRYYTGDLAVAKKIVNGQCLSFASLQGREISLLRRTDGILLSETNIMGHFKEFSEIGRYQIIQKLSDEYVMVLENAPETVDEKCVAELKNIFGQNAKTEIRHTDNIPCKASGKFAVTVSEL